MKECKTAPIPAALYARFSTENQNQESITNQVRECLRWAEQNNYLVKPDAIFADEAKSGTNLNRSELKKLRQRVATQEFKAVIVYNFARIARDLHDCLTLQAEFDYHSTDLISVAEGIKTSEPLQKMAFQMMGVVNQSQVDAVRRDTRNAQVGNIERGYVTGSMGFGYEVVKVGKSRIDSRGRLRADGSQGEIIQEEAEIIRRIYADFINCKSVTAIVKHLNDDKIQCRYSDGWAESTVSKILKNETYTGKYIWGKTVNIKNPLTGKKSKRDKPREEWIIKDRPNLRIIDDVTWEKAQLRWKAIDAMQKAKGPIEGWGKRQSYIHAYPPYLLAGLMKCKLCGGAIVQAGGKGDGYYGCQNAHARRRCSNRRMIPRMKLENAVITELKKSVLNVEAVKRIYSAVENAIKEHFKYLPDQMRQKNREIEQLQTKIRNLINYLSQGKQSDEITKTLDEFELRKKTLEAEIEEIKLAQKRIPKPPSEEEISAKLENLADLLNKDVTKSALLLRELLGNVTVEPKRDEKDREFLDCSGVLKSLTLLSHFLQGSNSLTMWRCRELNPGPKKVGTIFLHD